MTQQNAGVQTRNITNPILRGFNPDPSICRVGGDYYVATSTFEWYPGVRIYHSRDLRNWQLTSRPLNRSSLLNMLGSPDSCGVWAPCLSWHDGLFWLLYTDVKRFDGNFKDTHNYLTTSATIDGSWSEPVYLNSSGFDPSLFHDDDGRKWYVNMVWDHRPDRTFFAGIVLQEYLPRERRLTGERKFIFPGTALDCTEAPHLYRHGGYYYLMTAEGGTGYAHAVTMARARAIDGPYEPDPGGPLLTAAADPTWPLQRAGHGDFVVTPAGEVYLVHLCSRPLPGIRRSPLGRETAIQKMRWTADGWLRLEFGGCLPGSEVPAPVLAEAPIAAVTCCDHFDSRSLDPVYQWLRTPWPEEFLSLDERPGFLRLRGMESLGSSFRQALIARRQTDFVYEAETRLEFEPKNFQQMAGLVCYYNASKFHYLYVSADQALGKHLGIMSCPGNTSLTAEFPNWAQRIPLPAGACVNLKVRIDRARLDFYWRLDDGDWQLIPPTLDASVLSDEAGRGEGAQFTGAFVGMCCQDLTGQRIPADFDSFAYRALPG